ncbi:flagellar basal body rod C-terminal domain-containing protein, partial [Limnochorda pilosa]|uniref:flagellar basal body rod C-terminal domain-containing protein n=1 Tax=Limnochorda pilosa TaxID=1555112 RepID=UPI0026E9A5BB
QDDLLIVNDQTGIIRQGFLESSSVDLVKELTEMLITQRAYSINTRSIHAADEMWSMVNQLRR